MSGAHRSRRLALQGLCCIDAQGTSAWALVEDFIRDSREGNMIVDGALKMLRLAFDDRTASDELLSRHARRWELPRLALVDRNILRLAVHELRAGQTPPKVAISEALRLAREFSTAESPRFVNGVLDAVAKELHGQAPKPDEDALEEADTTE
ncbi:MAG: transcription antitermination factor NusB [Phycisphaerae bacterium]|nr:transcription antitermination factor NusB [Phycisphaerae bacterium]